MTRREAALILGIRESAAEERVKEAHRKIMIANHPDAGALQQHHAHANRTGCKLHGSHALMLACVQVAVATLRPKSMKPRTCSWARASGDLYFEAAPAGLCLYVILHAVWHHCLVTDWSQAYSELTAGAHSVAGPDYSAGQCFRALAQGFSFGESAGCVANVVGSTRHWDWYLVLIGLLVVLAGWTHACASLVSRSRQTLRSCMQRFSSTVVHRHPFCTITALNMVPSLREGR